MELSKPGRIFEQQTVHEKPHIRKLYLSMQETHIRLFSFFFYLLLTGTKIFCTFPSHHISFLNCTSAPDALEASDVRFALKTVEESDSLAHIWTCWTVTIQWISESEDSTTHCMLLYLFLPEKTSYLRQSRAVVAQRWGVLFWLHRTESCGWQNVKMLCLWPCTTSLFCCITAIYICHLL